MGKEIPFKNESAADEVCGNGSDRGSAIRALGAIVRNRLPGRISHVAHATALGYRKRELGGPSAA